MTNRDKLKQLLLDVFLLTDDQFSFDLRKESVDTWDSLGVVSLAVGIQETFGYHFTPEEATGVESVSDIVRILSTHGIRLDD
ncbi:MULTISPECIES: acyl carrier protein [Ramlibacter]|uniref:Acyl carrier protein n=1 Tax=Ramlibacter pinisoli TaxID=2682844 RepID=A0A6N8J3S7_9BURK|nr:MULTISPECIES: acyl carrier protein [Ramlibacter]MBA2962923.1 acyl carrier protein [Ramlibacter sp. CGMCC 1.13660]MVQ32866.1 acyl carrier protein [Ramlibacter pinisoli]